jgi:hypothetical protein
VPTCQVTPALRKLCACIVIITPGQTKRRDPFRTVRAECSTGPATGPKKRSSLERALRPPPRYRVQMGTKPAKVGRLGPRCAKVRRGPHAHPAPTGASAKRSSIHAASKVAKVGAAGGPKLLKWGRLRARQEAGSNLLKSDRRRHLTKRSSLHKKRSSLRGRIKVAKVGPLRARVKSAKVRPTPYVYYPRVTHTHTHPLPRADSAWPGLPHLHHC